MSSSPSISVIKLIYLSTAFTIFKLTIPSSVSFTYSLSFVSYFLIEGVVAIGRGVLDVTDEPNASLGFTAIVAAFTTEGYFAGVNALTAAIDFLGAANLFFFDFLAAAAFFFSFLMRTLYLYTLHANLILI